MRFLANHREDERAIDLETALGLPARHRVERMVVTPTIGVRQHRGELDAEGRHVAAVGERDERRVDRKWRRLGESAQLELGGRRSAELEQGEGTPRRRDPGQGVEVDVGEYLGLEIEIGFDPERAARKQAVERARVLGRKSEPIFDEIGAMAARMDASRPERGRAEVPARQARHARQRLEMRPGIPQPAEAPSGEPCIPMRQRAEGSGSCGCRQKKRLLVLADEEIPLGNVGACLVVILITERVLGIGCAQQFLGLGGLAARQVADLQLGPRSGVGLRTARRRAKVGGIVDDAAQRDRRAFRLGQGCDRRRLAAQRQGVHRLRLGMIGIARQPIAQFAEFG